MLNETKFKPFLDTCRDKILSYKLQDKAIYFSAKFFRKGKQVETIQKGESANFNKLLRAYFKTETPDKIVVFFYEQGTDTQLYKKELSVEDDSEVVEKIVGQQPMPLMGVDVVQEMIRKGIDEYKEEQQKEVLRRRLRKALGTIDEKDKAIEALEKEVKRLESEIEGIEDEISLDKRLKGYVAVAGEAFPALNGLIQKSSLRGLLGIPKEEVVEAEFSDIEQQQQEKGVAESEIDPKRKQMIEVLSNYFLDEENSVQYLHQLYLLFYHATQNPDAIPTLLELAGGTKEA